MDNMDILYVEDEPFLARIVQESLESRGFTVHLAKDGEQALVLYNRVNPRICILDVMLPRKDGFSLARDIRKKDPGIPIIFLTAKTQTADILEGFESGGNDYLRKPFSMEELIVRIHNLLHIISGMKVSDKPIQDKVELGKYGFFPGRYELHGPDGIRKLSQRETRLITLLSNGTNNPVLRKNILLDIWGDDSFQNSRNLDVYITRIREYFSGDPGIQIITIKGVGYHLQLSPK